MSDLPNGWEWLRLREIVSRTANVDPAKHPDEEFELYSVPSHATGSPEIQFGRDIGSTKQIVEPGDVLLCKIIPHLVRVWVVPPRSSRRQIASGEWIVYRDHCCDADYLRFALMEPLFREQFMRTISGVGGSLTRAKPEAVAEISIPLPPLPEQRRIVAKLDALLAGVARARKELDRVPILIAHHKQALLAAAFSGELTRDWRTKNATASSDAFVAERQKQIQAIASEPGRGRDEKSALLSADADLLSQLAAIANEQPIPQQWTWAGIGQVFGTYVGATPSRKEPRYWDGTINWVSSGEVAFCRISNTAERITEDGLNNASTRIHPPGTVLLGMIGEGKTRGQAAILDIPACNNQNCAAIRVSESGYPPEYVYWYLHLAYQTTRNAGSGNNQPALNKDRVQRLPIPLAPVEEAVEIARVIAAAFSWFDTVTDEHAHAAKLLPKLEQTILAKAFRGELVPQDPADEPASVLLQRIRADREGCIKVRRVAN